MKRQIRLIRFAGVAAALVVVFGIPSVSIAQDSDDSDDDVDTTECTILGIAAGGAAGGAAATATPQGAAGGALIALIGAGAGTATTYTCNNALQAARDAIEETLGAMGTQFFWGRPGFGFPNGVGLVETYDPLCLSIDGCVPIIEPTDNLQNDFANQMFLNNLWTGMGETLNQFANDGNPNSVTFTGNNFAGQINNSFTNYSVGGLSGWMDSISGSINQE